MKRKITSILMVVTLVGMSIWDWIVAHNDIKGDTISEITRDLSITNYLIPYVCGVVMGHLFWNAPNRDRMNLKVTAGSVVPVAALDAAGAHFPGGNLVALMMGIGVGAYFWPQTQKPSKGQT